jgi:hypothetical protein
LHFKKILPWTAAAFLLASGCNIPRDNPLDPKNPESTRPRKIMIEAFVNIETGFPYDGYMAAALDSLAGMYPDRVTFAEYYRNVQNYTTSYFLSENEILYEHYLGLFGADDKCVPDVFINGSEARIRGASSVVSALFRLQQILLSRMSESCKFSMEVKYSVAGRQIVPEITLVRLGDSDAPNLLVRAVLVSRMDALHRRVVTASVKSPLIEQLVRGEIKKISLPSMQADFSVKTEMIAILCDQDERVISQCETCRINP